MADNLLFDPDDEKDTSDLNLQVLIEAANNCAQELNVADSTTASTFSGK